MSVSLHLKDGYKTIATTRDLSLVIDEPVDEGGNNEGMKPSELLQVALGACVAITTKMYATRKGWALEEVKVDVDYNKVKAAEHSSYEGDADVVFDFTQKITFVGDLTEEQRARLLDIAGRCPIHKILTSPVYVEDALVDDDPVIDQFEMGD